MKSFAEIDIENNGNYLKLLSAVSKLSGLFSESSIPYINYRVAENIFCRSFDAGNLSRSDTAFDANYNSIGIGLKTFTCPSNFSNEKVAEFNSLSRELNQYKGQELAYKLAEFRNNRINLANRLYGIDNSIYHIVARKDKELVLFETDYNSINLNNVKVIKESKAGLQFEDGINSYSFNYSKSTLFRKFLIPNNAFKLPVDIIKDPYDLLLQVFNEFSFDFLKTEKLIPGKDYVILPLYGYNKKTKEKFVFEGSGLNQWNANGRPRDKNEVYIPVPAIIHHNFPNFFPENEQEKKHFILDLPNGKSFEASMCQTAKIEINGVKVNKGKGLMTKSNKGLGDWLLRKALQLKEGELATIEMLENLGYDSVIIYKINNSNYKIDIMKIDSYENFVSSINNS